MKFTITGSPAECGAEVTSNGTYIRYQNYIRDNDVTNDPTVATRSQVQIGFACEFPVDYRVALPAIMPTVSTVAVQTSRYVLFFITKLENRKLYFDLVRNVYELRFI